MFPRGYFSFRYFAPNFFPPVVQEEQPQVGGVPHTLAGIILRSDQIDWRFMPEGRERNRRRDEDLLMSGLL